MKKFWFAFVAFWSVVASAFAAYPDKPVKLVVAFAPGSSTDIVARLIADQLTTSMGQSMVVENRPGAGGNIASQAVMRSPADGYTLLVHSVAYSANPSLYANAGYDPMKDFDAIAIAGVAPNLIYVHPDVSAKSLPELLALAKNGKLAYASSGIGTTTHLGAEWLFKYLAKVDITHVPFQPAAATNAVVSGQVPVASTSLPPAVAFAKAGKVRPIAVMSAKRSNALPDVPTVAELGYKNFEANTWFAIFAPANTPTAVLDRLNAEVVKALAAKTTRDRYETLSLEAQPLTREETREYVGKEVGKWGKLIKEIGAKVE